MCGFEGLRMSCARPASGCSQNTFAQSLTVHVVPPSRILVFTSLLFKNSPFFVVPFIEKAIICSSTHAPSLDETIQRSNYRLVLLCSPLGRRWGVHRTTGVVVRHR